MRWLFAALIAAVVALSVAFQMRGDTIKALRGELSAVQSSVSVARAQIERQRRIINDHAAYIRSLEGGGNEALSDYLSGGAGRLWGAE